MKRLRILQIILVVLVFISCSDRKRSNPLDPQNPVTRGRPTGVRVWSEEREVIVRWQPLRLKGIDGINIYRRALPDSEFVFIARVASDSFEYRDRSVEYGETYEYYVTVQVGNYESPHSTMLTVTPGPTYTWVADIQSGYVTRLTHDLQTHLFDFGILNFPSLVAVSPRERMGWVYSKFGHRLYKVDAHGDVDIVLDNYSGVYDIEVDALLRDLWVSQPGEGLILRIQSNGIVNMVSRHLSYPTALAIDQMRHRCWAIDQKEKNVVRLTFDGRVSQMLQSEFVAPKDIAVNSTVGDVWVADSTRVLQFNFLGQPTGLIADGFYNARYLSVDEARGVCWVVDMEPPNTPASLIKLDSQGRVLFKLSEFGNPKCIAVNEFDGSCLLADSGYGYAGLWRISEDGSKIEYVDDFFAPYDIAIEYHEY